MTNKDLANYASAVRYLEGLSNLPLKYDYSQSRAHRRYFLLRPRYFLKLLGDPHQGFKCIHITGTAGKGSVAAAIHGLLLSSGKKAALVTSPFVAATVEKMKAGDRYISARQFADIVEEIKPAIDEAHRSSPYGRPSYFEILFAIACIYFKRRGCEWLVLEVGCGGRYDYTNVIGWSPISIITNIDRDHLKLIGPTLMDVAREKVGILKRGSVLITSVIQPRILRYLRGEARRQRSRFYEISGRSFLEKNRLIVRQVAQILGLPLAAAGVASRKARLPGRFETVARRPRVILDVAHNPIKLATVVENLKALKYRRLIIVCGFAANKDIRANVSMLAPVADEMIATRFQMRERKCADPELIARIAAREGVPVSTTLDLWRAFDSAMSKARHDDIVLVTGSFFLVGEIRTRFIPERETLRARNDVFRF